MDLNSVSLKAIFTGFKTVFQKGFGSVGDVGSIYEKICTIVPSGGSKEAYPFLKQLPRMREWLGDRVINSLEGAKFEIVNRKFELTEGVGRDPIEDDEVGLYSPLFEEMGRLSGEHPNELVVEVLEANPICYDGQNLFDTDHPVLDKDGNEQSVSNDMGGAGDAWYVMDLSRAIKPFIFQKRRPYVFKALTDLNSDRVFMTDEFLFGVDARVNAGAGLWQLIVRSNEPFTAVNYEAARKQLTTLKGDYDKPLALRHTHTMVPGSMEGAGRTILKNQNDAAGATNPWVDSSELILNPWLASS